MHEQLRRFTGIMHKLHGWVGGVVSTDGDGQREGTKEGSADEEDGQLSKTGSAESAISAQAEEGYNPIVSEPGGPVGPAYATACFLQHCLLKACNIWACWCDLPEEA